jgi:uncharacterized membrane protein
VAVADGRQDELQAEARVDQAEQAPAGEAQAEPRQELPQWQQELPPWQQEPAERPTLTDQQVLTEPPWLQEPAEQAAQTEPHDQAEHQERAEQQQAVPAAGHHRAAGSSARRPGARELLRHPLAVPVAGLALIALLTPLRSLWPVEVVVVLLLLIVPGVALLRVLRIDGLTVAAQPVYVPAASMLVLFGSGLAVDLVGPLIGISQPLRAAPILVSLLIVCAALLAGSRNAPAETDIPWGSLSHPVQVAWPLLIPLLSAWGALRLNSGHTAHVADLAVLVVIVAVIVTFLLAPRCNNSLLVIIVFATSLAMMWSFALRGSLVYGFDISSEYYSLSQTVTSGIWHVSHPNDAYGAMLSLTIFPAQLHALSGISALMIFKLVFPVIGAFFPVAVFSLARRALDGRWAFMAAALVIMQQTFFQQLPALARQEIAMVLFAALMCAVLDSGLTLRARWIFVCLLSTGMVLAHYSTAYLAIPLLAIAAVMQWGASWLRPMPRIAGVALIACVVSTAGAAIWYGSLTHSTSNMSQFVQAAEGQGLNLLPNSGANVVATYLQGESNTALTPAQYQSMIASQYKVEDPFISPLPNAGQPQYALKAASDPNPPVTFTLGANGLNLGDLLIQQLLNVLAAVAAAVMALRRKAPLIARQIGLLGLAGIVLLILVRVSGTIAEEYNPQRAFLQLLIVLAIGICWLFQLIGARYARTRTAILAIGGATLGVYMLGTTGLGAVAVGGGTASNLANSGVDYQEFVMNSQDLAAASWVNQNAPIGQFIYADHYAQLRLDTVAGPNRPGVFDAITPQTLDQHAWVYATSVNLKYKTVDSLAGDDETQYAFPSRFLDSNYDVVYTSGSSEVFHR